MRCRGIQAISADGVVNLDRHDACYDTTKSIIVKITDTCEHSLHVIKFSHVAVQPPSTSIASFHKLCPHRPGPCSECCRPLQR